ncbi:hypothetical protein HED60_01095 [Planctomycetales bacterium ZRK34]|nr:hypothetical protein HED60_01095 [Planctomycetales bacterium ZRK34]
MPIEPLPILSEEEEAAAIEKLQPPKTVVVRYGFMKQIAELTYDGDQVLGCGTKLIIRTSRGVELAEMLTTTCSNSGCGSSVSRQKMLDYIEQSGGKQYPFTTEGKVLRVATVEDLNDQSRIDSEKTRYIKAARDVIRELDLPMKLVEVEQLISRDRIVFYFTSENRIDFRELVRRLAGEFHVRVEMRQVGARDEARLVADYERCGQHCCCKQFLKVLKPVSMRSAKVQKATLDPTKISGRCGRLMCCLRYEDETYEALRKKLPKRNARVMTDDGPGSVINSQILTQLVLVELDQGRKRQAYPVEHIERLPNDGRQQQQQKKKADDQSEPRGKRSEPSRPKPGRPLRDEQVESADGAPAAEVNDSKPDTDAPQANASQPTGDQPAEGGQRKKRRRRRRRKKRGGGGGDGNNPSGGDNANRTSGPPPSDN